MTRTLGPAMTLWSRELTRFVRQRRRAVSTLLQPVIFWLFFGFGFEDSFSVKGTGEAGPLGALEYFFPGMVVMMVLFAAIFSTIAVIRDRNEGFLQTVLVAPVSRQGIVLGKIAGGATLALLQGVLLLCLAPLAGVPFTLGGFALAVGVLVVLSFALTGVGLFVAWPMDSIQAYHAIMMLVLMPMWLLSGAIFPVPGGVLGWVMRANPLTYGVSAFRWALYGQGNLGQEPCSWSVALAVTLAFAALAFVGCLWAVGARSRKLSR